MILSFTHTHPPKLDPFPFCGQNSISADVLFENDILLSHPISQIL